MEQAVLIGLLLVSGVWYWVGNRRGGLRAVGGRRRRPVPLWRAIAFYGALLSILVALAGPLDRLTEELLWAHMVQHIILMLVAAPLLVLGAPWLPLWRPLPLGFRRRVASAVVQGPRFATVRRTARWAAGPLVAWGLFNGDLAVWHVPALYDLTVRNTAVHYLEHLSFLVLGLLFWAQVVDSPPFHPRLGDFQRALFLTAGAVASWLLAVVLALSPTPFYSAYSSIQPRPEGLPALTDQQLAGGAMWGPGSIPFAIGVFWLLYVWLGEDDGKRRRRSAHRGGLATGGRPGER